MERTTDLNEITFGKRSNFTWGEAIKIHEIGEYTIVEYHPWEYKNNSTTTRLDYSNSEYSCYLNHQHLGLSTYTLDEALATCIAYKHDGINSHAAHYFMKMIKKESIR